MPWKEETIMSTKEEFVRRAIAKQLPFSKLCAEFKITRKTGYRILAAYLNHGPAGLAPQSKKPHSSPSKTNPIIEEAIIAARHEDVTWGARKIIRHLSNKGMKNLPSITTVNGILKRNNLITIEESMKRQKLIRFEREKPNDLWQMDFKGKFQILTKQSCYPLTILDDHSRFSLCIKAGTNEQYLTVKKQLIVVFNNYGLPDQINVDNGNPWGNSKLLAYTELSLWLMRLGIRVSHSRPRHPQTNGKLERFHRTLKNDLISRYPMRSISHAQKLFNDWRHRYNYIRPHEAIDMNVPAQRYKESSRQMPTRLAPIEYGENAILRKVRGNGYVSYRNKEYHVGEAFKNHMIEIKEGGSEHSINVYFGNWQIYTYDS